MNQHETTQIQKNEYISLKISYPKNPEKPEIKIKRLIQNNGICNIDDIAAYFNIPNLKNKPISNRIQIAVNRNDLSLRLLHPYSSIWSLEDHITFYEEDETNEIIKRQFQNSDKKIWMEHAGSTSRLNKTGNVYAYPNKIIITFKLKKKSGNFVEQIYEKKPLIKFLKEADTGNEKDLSDNSIISKESKITLSEIISI